MEKEQQSQQIQIGVDPNAYAITNVNLAFDEELFHFLLTTGNQGRQFAVTPKHAKRILLLLKKQVEEYENKFGEIKTKLPERPPASPSLGGQTTQEQNNVGF